MKKIIKIPLIILGSVFVLFIGLMIWAVNSPTENDNDPFDSPDLVGEKLESFLNSPFRYSSISHNETINDVFYSNNHKPGFNIGMPKDLGRNRKVTNIAIIINENDIPVIESYLIVYFNHYEDGTYALNKVTQHDSTSTKTYGFFEEINQALLQVYPDNFFVAIAGRMDELHKGIEDRKREDAERKIEEQAARFTPEGWPRNSIYTSSLFLREGIDDVRATVGEVFYTGSFPEGISVDEPTRSGRMYVIHMTIRAPSDTVKTSIYLNYNEGNQISLIDRIVMAGNRQTQTASTFEEKYQVILMLLSAMRGN